MTLYVDHARIPFGRMRMSHLLASTPAELRTAARALGLSRHIQAAGTPKEHLDVCESVRLQAIRTLGAEAVDRRTIGRIIAQRRNGPPTRVVEGNT